jgi:hypothetical protein
MTQAFGTVPALRSGRLRARGRACLASLGRAFPRRNREGAADLRRPARKLRFHRRREFSHRRCGTCGRARRSRQGALGDRRRAGDLALLSAEQIRVEAAIAAAAGDLGGAQSLVWRYVDAVASSPNARSLKAAVLRLYGLWAIEEGTPERAFEPLKESGDLYAEIGGAIGGAIGAKAVAAARKAAKCV